MDDTKNKIISVASELFFIKGYDKTRIIDIINRLDGLTKGAIYHYFDSKEDIFNSVMNEIGKRNIIIFDKIKFDNKLNGREKLIKIVNISYNNDNMKLITENSPNLLENPKLLSFFINEIKDITIPKYIMPIVKQGIDDKSIVAQDAQELSEAIAILLNIWLNPLIFDLKISKLNKKMQILNKMLSNFNIELFEGFLIDKYKEN